MGVLTPRGKPFYGWTIAGVLCVFGAVGVGLAGANFALFIVPMTEELGWSSSTFGWAFFLRFLMILAAGPLIGRLIDLRGPRLPVVGAVLVAGAAVLWLSRVAAVWELALAFMLIGIVGMGRANDLQAGAPIAQWFVRRRGLAMGIALAGTPLGVAVYYPVTQALIDGIGWRGALTALAVSGMAIAVPLALLLRRQPEDAGLLPDGDTPSSGEASGVTLRAASAEERSLTRREAMRTRRFWLMLAGFTAMTYGLSTLTIYRVPHFVERGLDPTLVAAAISVDAVIAVVASVLLGRVLDRAPLRIVLLGGIAVGALCAGGTPARRERLLAVRGEHLLRARFPEHARRAERHVGEPVRQAAPGRPARLHDTGDRGRRRACVPRDRLPAGRRRRVHPRVVRFDRGAGRCGGIAAGGGAQGCEVPASAGMTEPAASSGGSSDSL